jgi:hypothetical protein
MSEEEKTTEEENVTEEATDASEKETAAESDPVEEKKADESKPDKESKKSDEKPLDKMTVKELKEIAKDIPEIIGVHGMNKPDLLSAIKKARGIEEEPKKKTDVSLLELKKKIKSLKVKREEALASKDKKMATIYKRKISKLKKKTRQAA